MTTKDLPTGTEDPLGKTAAEFFLAMAEIEEEKAIRSEANGETIGPVIHRRRARWYRQAASAKQAQKAARKGGKE